MNPNATQKLIEPWVVRLIRKVATWAIGLLLAAAVARGMDLDPAKAAEWAIIIGTAVGVPMSYGLSMLGDWAVKKYFDKKA